MKQIVILDGEYEYDLIIEDGNYLFYHSKSECWQEITKGTLAYEVKNDGNGIKIESKNLDYSQSYLLYIALRLEHKDHNIEIGKLEKL
jgi:hypothetical protein